MTSRATSQMSLLLDRRYSRIHTQVHIEILDKRYVVCIQKILVKYFWDLFTFHLSKLFSNQTMEKLQTKQMLVLKTVYV